MAIRSIHSLSVGSLVFAVVVLALSATSTAQSSTDEIHVLPRVAIGGATREIDASLDTHTKPIKKEVELVLVPVTITDSLDRLVVGLEQDNFQVFDGKQPQDIKHFSSEDTPVSLGVIFDLSGSMKDKIGPAREAVGEFLRTANPQDEFFIITFAVSPKRSAISRARWKKSRASFSMPYPKGAPHCWTPSILA